MKTCSRCNQAKSFNEFSKRTASKDGYTAACKLCLNEQKKLDYTAEPEKTMQRVKKNHKKRRESDPIYRRAWNQWCYAKELGRVPAWVSFSKHMFPRYRTLLNKFPEWSVDHIIPLQGKIVSGLHVPENLQALPVSENSSKSNYFHPDLLPLYDK